MNFCQHTANTAPGRSFDNRNTRSDHSRIVLQLRALRIAQRCVRLLRQRDQPRAIQGTQLKHVAGKGGQLRMGQSHDLVPIAFEAAQHGFALHPVRNRLGANHGQLLAHVHHHVSVINRYPVRVERVEGNDLIIEPLRELPQRAEMRPA